jgi:hypothetical protein
MLGVRPYATDAETFDVGESPIGLVLCLTAAIEHAVRRQIGALGELSKNARGLPILTDIDGSLDEQDGLLAAVSMLNPD